MDLKSAAASLKGNGRLGNGILYNMCSDTKTNIKNPNHLADMIWLIGRTYAASPERRTYGYEKDENGKTKRNENNKRISLWKAQNSANGKGDFFIEIANYITKDKKFNDLTNIINALKNSSYKYDGSDSDIEMLCNGIYAVYLYNRMIREASEDFDDLNDKSNPKAVKAKENNAHCKNQISFCSKFLHFCCPNIVFIIDQYSYEGGKKLIPKKRQTHSLEFEESSLSSINLNNEYETTLAAVNNFNKQKDISCSADSMSTDYEKISLYIEHCVRAYCVSQYLQSQQIKITPRLIDDLFLRIK